MIAGFVLAVLSLLGSTTFAFVHDEILPHHTPIGCTCIPWSANTSSAALWGNASLHREQSTSAACAMPANALTPDLALPINSPSDGWCLCDSASPHWYTWCTPPATYPSQINLLIVNATSLVVNFVTADNGERAGCVAEAEVEGVGTFLGYSTLYRDRGGSRHLSYHHATMSVLKERTNYRYRVRVSNISFSPSSAPPAPTPISWIETRGIKWCSGGDLNIGYDPFGNGFDGRAAAGDTHCPILPDGVGHDILIGMCEEVCAAANLTAQCAGFTFYPSTAANVKHAECCFRTDTSKKPKDRSSLAECYEKHGGAPPPVPAAAACSTTPSEWTEWTDFTSLYSSGAVCGHGCVCRGREIHTSCRELAI